MLQRTRTTRPIVREIADRAIVGMAQHSSSTYPATSYYAFNRCEIARGEIGSTGWATVLQAVIEAGDTVVGIWPMRLRNPVE